MSSQGNSRLVTVVVAGSETGGHIIPLNAISQALRKKTNVNIVFFAKSGDKFSHLLEDGNYDSKINVFSGKWRRYHGEGWRQILDFKSHLLNIRDAFLVVAGLIQSYIKIRRLKPAIIFANGGSVGVPVGLAAAWYKIPIITHDSDSTAGISNRILARWAVEHTVAMDPKGYKYPLDDTTKVGIPIDEKFFNLDSVATKKVAEKLKLDSKKPIVLVLGGSLGSASINMVVKKIADKITLKAQVIHVLGKQNFDINVNLPQKNYYALDFISGNMPEFLNLADIVVTRAGATALTEIAAVGRPMIIIPGEQLTGGHQILNAMYYAEKGAARIISETDLLKSPDLLENYINELLSNDFDLLAMINAQKKLVVRNSADKIATIIVKYLKRTPSSKESNGGK